MHGNKDPRFVYCPAEEGCDAEFKLAGSDTISIQVCLYAGGFCVNEAGYETPGDLSSYYVCDRGTFKSLAVAQRKALELAKA